MHSLAPVCFLVSLITRSLCRNGLLPTPTLPLANFDRNSHSLGNFFRRFQRGIDRTDTVSCNRFRRRKTQSKIHSRSHLRTPDPTKNKHSREPVRVNCRRIHTNDKSTATTTTIPSQASPHTTHRPSCAQKKHDRETRDRHERTWIYMLHQQAPPPTRHADAPPVDMPSGFIPLAPMSSHAPSPLVAARAAAASLALHVNNTNNNTPTSATWAAAAPSSQPSPLPSRTVRPAETTSVFGGMVKLEKQRAAKGNTQKPQTPRPSSFVFRSIISKPSVPEAPSASAHVHRAATDPANGLMELLPKRVREEDDAEDHYNRRAREDEEYDEEAAEQTKGSKRACLPKKCDFPMCKNSSRSRGFCYSHGGGRRCRVDNCANGAVSRDLCKRHGGGRRCRIAGCKSSAESGGLCYSHGGGRRCNLGWCNARAKRGGYCAAHVDNRNALPPVDVVENEREEKKAEQVKAPVKIAAKPATSATAESVNPLVIETLLSLSKSPSQSETEDNRSAASPTDMMSPRLANPYAIASILN